MGSILFILNEAPYGSGRAYNALCLADVFSCAKARSHSMGSAWMHAA
ncbi:MAG: hypothetical protein Q7T94_03490 [Rugosibacter sp.]|jgi:sulfur relay (sulfurtransferase) DsrF/TusC family protein|nr:hypothetical protein [Rugosibacter sp.]